jgi:hypothetical protein
MKTGAGIAATLAEPGERISQQIQIEAILIERKPGYLNQLGARGVDIQGIPVRKRFSSRLFSKFGTGGVARASRVGPSSHPRCSKKAKRKRIRGKAESKCVAAR